MITAVMGAELVEVSMHVSRQRTATPGQFRYPIPITCNQRLFLCTVPAFYLFFGQFGIIAGLKSVIPL
jgi:hypothetical protein